MMNLAHLKSPLYKEQENGVKISLKKRLAVADDYSDKQSCVLLAACKRREAMHFAHHSQAEK